MHLYLVNTMNRLRVGTVTFFRICHVYCYGTDPQLHDAVAQYKLHGVIPPYVERYLRMLQADEGKTPH